MPRPKNKRRIGFRPPAYFFKPAGVPLRIMKVMNLSEDEVEALRLKHIKEESQLVAAKNMHISQSTFQRILVSAHKKMAQAMINGYGIRIDNLNEDSTK